MYILNVFEIADIHVFYPVTLTPLKLDENKLTKIYSRKTSQSPDFGSWKKYYVTSSSH